MGRSWFRPALVGALVIAAGAAGALLGPKMLAVAAPPPPPAAPKVHKELPYYKGRPFMISIQNDSIDANSKVAYAVVTQPGRTPRTYYWAVLPGRQAVDIGKKKITVVFDAANELPTPPIFGVTFPGGSPGKHLPTAPPPISTGTILSLWVGTDTTTPPDAITLQPVPPAVDPCL